MTAEKQTVLVLSTNHLPEEVMGMLGKESVLLQNHLIAPYVYGAFVWVPDASERATSLPEELARVMTYAGERGCQWVRFDSDGPLEDDLPAWEW